MPVQPRLRVKILLKFKYENIVWLAFQKNLDSKTRLDGHITIREKSVLYSKRFLLTVHLGHNFHHPGVKITSAPSIFAFRVQLFMIISEKEEAVFSEAVFLRGYSQLKAWWMHVQVTYGYLDIAVHAVCISTFCHLVLDNSKNAWNLFLFLLLDD